MHFEVCISCSNKSPAIKYRCHIFISELQATISGSKYYIFSGIIAKCDYNCGYAIEINKLSVLIRIYTYAI